MKKFERPTIDVERMVVEDVITTSNCETYIACDTELPQDIL